MMKLRHSSAVAIVSLAAAIALSLGHGTAAQVATGPRALAPIEPRARAGAPNVLLVLLDDVGFGAASTFGGPVPTPNYEALAAQGLRYNRFHTTSMCSPTRAAMLTGRNHHHVSMGGIVNLADGDAGYTSVIPKSAATIGKVLQLNGYSTAWFGKDHVTPLWEITPVGPFDRWPNGLGFDYFYGFMDGATDQWTPTLVENKQAIEPPASADYILDKDLADHTIQWLQQHQSVAPQQPFFAYLAPGTAHVPLQAPKAWIAKFKGKFDQGWDAMRQTTFERQKRMGVIPADTQLTPRPASIPAWDSLNDKQKAVAARLMEVHAAQLAYFDEQFGRIVAELKRSGQWDNTIVMYIDGDNGPSGESGLNGTVIETLNGGESSVDYMYTQLEQMGGPRTFDGYPVGWGWAMATPFQYTKQVASHLGGTRDGLVVSWPKRIRDQGGLRSQYLHVTDIAPTLYEALGIATPKQVDGVTQMPFDGVSFAYTFDQPNAPSRHRTQYYEMLGNRAFYKDGWIASTTPAKTPWERKAAIPPEQYQWELYNLDTDFSQSRNLAKDNPKKLAELQAGFAAAAKQNQVLPLDNNALPRMRGTELRPYATLGREHFEYFRSATRLSNEGFPDLKNRAWNVNVSLTLSSPQVSGTLVTQGGWVNGWGLFVMNGVPTFIYKADELPGQLWKLSANTPLTVGEHQVQVRIVPDASAAGAAATVTLMVDGQVAGTMKLARTVSNAFTNEGIGIGQDFGTPLSDDYAPPFRFPGEMGPVLIDVPGGSTSSAQR